MDKILKTLTDLIKIPSVSSNDKEIKKVFDYCRKYFRGQKVYIREFKYEHASPVMLISNKKTDNFDIMVVGHLDVVPAQKEQFKPKIEGNRLYGRGSSDMKHGIAVAFNSMDYILQNKLDINFAILMTTDEETSSNGIKKFVKNESGIYSAVIIDNDAGDLKTIIEKYKHSVGVKIKAEGQAGHSSQPWNNINAVNKLMAGLTALEKYFPEYSKDGRRPKNTWIDTMVVTSISSPLATNITPDWAEALLNFRLTDKTGLNDLEKILKKVCSKNACAYEIFMASCGCYMDAKSRIIQDYKKIAESVIGEKVTISHMHGATDARMFADKSVIIMHGADGGDIHNEKEYLEIDSLYKLAEIQIEFIKHYIRG